jgi:predicted molibdopterin-dependent oxidoreductase YjgC
MMGVCYDCLVTIDGQANQQGCMTAVREGMKIERQLGARKVQA